MRKEVAQGADIGGPETRVNFWAFERKRKMKEHEGGVNSRGAIVQGQVGELQMLTNIIAPTNTVKMKKSPVRTNRFSASLASRYTNANISSLHFGIAGLRKRTYRKRCP